jgi:hypothetical protein
MKRTLRFDDHGDFLNDALSVDVYFRGTKSWNHRSRVFLAARRVASVYLMIPMIDCFPSYPLSQSQHHHELCLIL